MTAEDWVLLDEASSLDRLSKSATIRRALRRYVRHLRATEEKPSTLAS